MDELPPLDRSRTTLLRLGDPADNGFVPGTMAERIAMVWPLTVELAALSGLDVEQRLQRHVTSLSRRKR